jgi:transposase, IS6 family
VDQNAAYPVAIRELKAEETLSKRTQLRPCRYLNNIVEQDRRTVKRRARLAMGYGLFRTAWKTLQGIETMHLINKGRVRWLAKGDIVGQVKFISKLFGLAA